eukprot:TRINITY_DN2000_c0_g1_i1.p1 TRINITY_DN2000_c0_g1~~TRINITY_DN2000_c0_g1_i1.p1  ORF type:complete len:468 (-),score=70.47 TRINITY_DN2000_c0_g1_i1:50-1453(-)
MSKRTYGEVEGEDTEHSDLGSDHEDTQEPKRRRTAMTEVDDAELNDLENGGSRTDVNDRATLVWAQAALDNGNLSVLTDKEIDTIYELETALVAIRDAPADEHWRGLLERKTPILAFLEDPFRTKSSTLPVWIEELLVPEDLKSLVLNNAARYWDSERSKLNHHIVKALWSEANMNRRQLLRDQSRIYIKSEDGKAFVLAIGSTYGSNRIPGSVMLPSLKLKLFVEERLLVAKQSTSKEQARKLVGQAMKVQQLMEHYNVTDQTNPKQSAAKKAALKRAPAPPLVKIAPAPQKDVAITPPKAKGQSTRAPLAPVRPLNASPQRVEPVRAPAPPVPSQQRGNEEPMPTVVPPSVAPREVPTPVKPRSAPQEASARSVPSKAKAKADSVAPNVATNSSKSTKVTSKANHTVPPGPNNNIPRVQGNSAGVENNNNTRNSYNLRGARNVNYANKQVLDDDEESTQQYSSEP